MRATRYHKKSAMNDAMQRSFQTSSHPPPASKKLTGYQDSTTSENPKSTKHAERICQKDWGINRKRSPIVTLKSAQTNQKIASRILKRKKSMCRERELNPHDLAIARS